VPSVFFVIEIAASIGIFLLACYLSDALLTLFDPFKVCPVKNFVRGQIGGKNALAEAEVVI